MTRPALARTSSAASGLRFCGMIDEPVVNLSDRATKPNCGVVQMTISSARRDRCMAAIGRRRQGLEGEIAIGHAVERVGASAGRSRAPWRWRQRSIGKGGAGERRGAERAFVEAPPGIGEAAAVARTASPHRPADGGRRSPAAPIADG